MNDYLLLSNILHALDSFSTLIQDSIYQNNFVSYLFQTPYIFDATFIQYHN